MKKKTLLLLSAFAAICSGMPLAVADADTQKAIDVLKADAKKVELNLKEDFKAVLDAAKKDRKKIFLEFSGLDWCPPCKMLHRFVVNTEKFANYANEKLHTMVLDFSRTGNPKNTKFAKQYIELAQKYSLEGFPTVIILSPDGEVIDTMVGLQVRTPEDLIKRIENAK